ncbi:response regulator [Sphingomonas sp. PB4P5]|uniref:response regulator n=1 Tax=Parasphingomonas puruogangriensis TaxID=3096155 RepID=UPI002FC82DE6
MHAALQNVNRVTIRVSPALGQRADLMHIVNGPLTYVRARKDVWFTPCQYCGRHIDADWEQPVCHVLIIEDEALIALDLQDILMATGASTFAFAETEQEAIDAARLQRPDVITSDVMLREGSGPKAVETILGEMGPLPVIFITATPHACITCLPPVCILSKPVSDAAVRRAFRAVTPH